jgi:hypothetical protein
MDSACIRCAPRPNALSHAADIAKVQEWLGHANHRARAIGGQNAHRKAPSTR